MLKSMKKLGGGKRKPAETVVTYQKKVMPAAPKSISKSDTEEKMARIEGMKEEQAELTQGEKDYGPIYKSLGIKGTRRTEIDPKSGDVSVKAKYKSLAGDEEVERIPNSEMLKVKKLGEAAKATDYPEFKETFKERIERLASEKKSAGRSKAMSILEAVKREKAKSQAKAGM